jgi:cytochrome c biogenesis protein CcmG/thiol:disulfide interchange protein DsbE
MKHNPVAIAAVLVVGALLALLAYGVVARAPAGGIDAALAAGERPRPPALDLPQLGSDAHARLSDYRGQVVVLNFWASWCGPCREESPLLDRWHRRLERSDALVLGVNVEDVTSDAKSFIRKHDLTFPSLRDREGTTARRFGATGYPETLVIDRQGRIAAARRGPVDEAFMRAEVQPLVKEGRAQ